MADRLCNFMLNQGLPLILGYFVLLIGSLSAVPAVMSMNRRRTGYVPPPGVTAEAWRHAAEIDDDQRAMIKFYGWMEATYFFVSIWLGAPLVVGGWLAFKLGSKWEVWQTIVKVPADGEKLDADGVAKLATRNRWASKVLTAHLSGTLANILVAGVAVGVGRLFAHIVLGQPLVLISPVNFGG